MPRHRRRIGYVFQDARLFPHLTVRRNLLYGRWFAGRAPSAAAASARWSSCWASATCSTAGPVLLSGGERQRVAIGRACSSAPRLLLLDEPLASLDQARKGEILPYLDRLCREAGLPILFVSHALDEVARLATTMVLLSGGRVAASGPVGEVMARLDLGRRLGVGGGAMLHLQVVGGPGRARSHSPDASGRRDRGARPRPAAGPSRAPAHRCPRRGAGAGDGAAWAASASATSCAQLVVALGAPMNGTDRGRPRRGRRGAACAGSPRPQPRPCGCGPVWRCWPW